MNMGFHGEGKQSLSLTGAGMPSGIYERLSKSLYRVRLLIAASALAVSWVIPVESTSQRLVFVALVGLVYLPYSFLLFMFSKRWDSAALRVATVAGDLGIVFLFHVLVPPTRMVALFGYLLIVTFYALLGGLAAGSFISVCTIVLTLAAQFLLPPGLRLDTYTLVMYWSVLFSMTLLVHATSREQRRLVRELRESEERSRLVVQGVQEYAIFMLDTSGRVMSWNEGAERINGYSPEEIVGKHFSIFYTEEDRARGHPDFELKTAAKDGRFEEEGWRLRKDGTKFWANVLVTPIRDERERMHGYGKVVRDLTQQKRTKDAMELALDRERAASAQLRRLDQMKNAFLQAVSHDLRTPLTAILGFARTLELRLSHLPPEEVTHLVRRITSNSERLQNMLLDLLDLDRLSRGIIQPKRIPTDLRVLTLRVLESLDFGDRLIHSEVESGTFLGDPSQVERIVENLLANANKHTPSGSPIWLEARIVDEQLEIVVEDEGPGVPDEDKDSIFEPFRQGEGPHASGTGIGLSLVARFAELNGGRAWVEDRSGGGSSFRVVIPSVEVPAELTA
jgi:PAS domain S-box-containing protein